MATDQPRPKHRDGHRVTEVIAGDGVGALQLGGLLPAGCRLREDIRPAGISCVAVCTDYGGRARDGDRGAEVIAGDSVGALQLAAACFQTAPDLVNTYARPTPLA